MIDKDVNIICFQNKIKYIIRESNGRNSIWRINDGENNQ